MILLGWWQGRPQSFSLISWGLKEITMKLATCNYDEWAINASRPLPKPAIETMTFVIWDCGEAKVYERKILRGSDSSKVRSYSEYKFWVVIFKTVHTVCSAFYSLIAAGVVNAKHWFPWGYCRRFQSQCRRRCWLDTKCSNHSIIEVCNNDSWSSLSCKAQICADLFVCLVFKCVQIIHHLLYLYKLNISICLQKQNFTNLNPDFLQIVCASKPTLKPVEYALQ